MKRCWWSAGGALESGIALLWTSAGRLPSKLSRKDDDKLQSTIRPLNSLHHRRRVLGNG